MVSLLGRSSCTPHERRTQRPVRTLFAERHLRIAARAVPLTKTRPEPGIVLLARSVEEVFRPETEGLVSHRQNM